MRRKVGILVVGSLRMKIGMALHPKTAEVLEAWIGIGDQHVRGHVLDFLVSTVEQEWQHLRSQPRRFRKPAQNAARGNNDVRLVGLLERSQRLLGTTLVARFLNSPQPQCDVRYDQAA